MTFFHNYYYNDCVRDTFNFIPSKECQYFVPIILELVVGSEEHMTVTVLHMVKKKTLTVSQHPGFDGKANCTTAFMNNYNKTCMFLMPVSCSLEVILVWPKL